MSVRELIDAIASGDSLAVEQNFNAEMANRISERLDTMRIEVAKNMFKEQAEPVEQAEEVQEDELTLEDFSIEEIEEYMVSEEFEQLDELSKTTLRSYAKKASQNAKAHRADAEYTKNWDKEQSTASVKKAQSREAGVKKAIGKLAKEEVEQAE